MKTHTRISVLRRDTLLLGFTMLICALIAITPARAAEEIVNFGNLDNPPGVPVPSLTVGSLTVTGSNNIVIDDGSGLGIELGAPPPTSFLGNKTVDPGETVVFEFTSPAANITTVGVTGCSILEDYDGLAGPDDELRLDVILRAYDAGGTLLNEVAFSTTTCAIDFSAALGTPILSRLEMTVVEDKITIPGIRFDTGLNPVPEYTCTGFQPPFDEPLILNGRSQRALPVKMLLTSGVNTVVTDETISALPVIEVEHDTSDIWDLLTSGDDGMSTEFRYDPEGQQWIFILYTRLFTDPGTYTVTVATGNEDEYTLDTTASCQQTFTVPDYQKPGKGKGRNND